MEALKHIGYRLAWNLRPLFNHEGQIPLNVDLELTNVCNFRCTMCHQSTGWLKPKDKTYMSIQMARKVIDQCAELGVPAMKVNWRGEPLLNDIVVDVIRYMKIKGIPEVQMNTNGSLLTSETSRKLIKAGLDRIIFSCDGASPSTYNSIRKGGSFIKFVQNVTKFALAKKKLNGKTKIRINVTLQKKNMDEKRKIKDLFYGIADEYRFNKIYNPQGKIKGGEKRVKKRRGCPQIYQRLVVSAEGNLIPCCVDYLEKLKIGNINDMTIFDAYHMVSKIREAHEEGRGRSLEGCKDCDNFALLAYENKKKVWK